MTFFLITFLTTFLRLACFSFFFRAFISARAALCYLLPFLYLPIFFLSAAIAFSSFESFFLAALALPFCFEAFFLALCSFSFSFLSFFWAFLPPFLMTFLRLACFSFFFRAFILASAALCSLLPFLYLPIFFLSAAIAFSSFESFFLAALALPFCFEAF